jgi:Protein of unknown function (DUF3800)
MAILHGYFDESGTHLSADATVISGFVGTIEDWDAVEEKWRAAVDGQVFHYVDCKHQKKAYERWDTVRCNSHIDRLAAVLGESNLRSVVASYRGSWQAALTHIPKAAQRFPNAYSFSLEACIETIRHFTRKYWDNSDIALVFSRQDEYAPRAHETWDTFKYNGLWPEIVSFAYGEPAKLWPLQAADMIAHESYLATLAVAGADELARPDSKNPARAEWPLMRALVERNRIRDIKGVDVGSFYTFDALENMLVRLPSEPLKKRPAGEPHA